MNRHDFLVEIGTEELPPKSLAVARRRLRTTACRRWPGNCRPVALRRRRADLPRRAGWPCTCARSPTSSRSSEITPAVRRFAAFDADRSADAGGAGLRGVLRRGVEQLLQARRPRASSLFCTHEARRRCQPPAAAGHRPGRARRPADRPTHALGRRARTNSSGRSTGWSCCSVASVIEGEILGMPTGTHTQGHRFHAPHRLRIATPAGYAERAARKGSRASPMSTARRERIRAGVDRRGRGDRWRRQSSRRACSTRSPPWSNGRWRCPGASRMRFLALPREVLIATMQDHQRYFPVRDRPTASCCPTSSPSPTSRAATRTRCALVMNASFVRASRMPHSSGTPIARQRLEARCVALEAVTFQAKLGSLADKSDRVTRARRRRSPDRIGGGAQLAERAAELCKCDLLTPMVGEFPELQGMMGKYYAQHRRRSRRSRHGDRGALSARASPVIACRRPATGLALADRGQARHHRRHLRHRPEADRHPGSRIGLRRAALGVLRILIEIEHRLDLDLRAAGRIGRGYRSARSASPRAAGRGYLRLPDGAPARFLPRGSGRPRRHDGDVRRRARDTGPHRRSTSMFACRRWTDSSQLPEAAEPRGCEQAHRQHPSQGDRRSAGRGRSGPAAGAGGTPAVRSRSMPCASAVDPLDLRGASTRRR